MEMKDGCSSDPPFHPAFQLFCYPIFLHKKSEGIDELIHKIGRENVLFAQQPNNYRIPHKPFLRRNGGRSGLDIRNTVTSKEIFYVCAKDNETLYLIFPR